MMIMIKLVTIWFLPFLLKHTSSPLKYKILTFVLTRKLISENAYIKWLSALEENLKSEIEVIDSVRELYYESKKITNDVSDKNSILRHLIYK